MPSDRYQNASIALGEKCSDLVDETLATWQRRTTRQLNREDGRQIIENMVGFFNILREWDDAERVRRLRTKRPS
jgi:hypothetical protein